MEHGLVNDRRVRAGLAILAGLFALVVFRDLVASYPQRFEIDLGRITSPANRYTYFAGAWLLFGSIAAVLLALGIALAASRPRALEELIAPFQRVPAWAWIGLVSLFAFATAGAINLYALEGAPLTDDESAYEFSARLLASGRLWALSHEVPAAFDRKFMINDGRMYSQYFLGWPALMTPFVRAGIAEFANAAYHALTIAPLYLVVRRCGGWPRLTTALFALSPMLMIGAATQMAHTSCLAALGWLSWAVLRGLDDDAPVWTGAAIAGLFGIMFFIRPTTALGGGGPLLVIWAWRTWRRPGRVRQLVTFTAIGMAFAVLFFAVNWLQNGSVLKTAYGRAIEYAHSIEFKNWRGPRRDGVNEFFHLDPFIASATFAVATFRLNFALLGWPCSFLFAFFVVRDPRVRWAWASLAGIFLVHVFVRSVGVDSFGPVKYFEGAFPLLVLTGVGVAETTRRAQALQLGPEHGGFRNLRPELFPVCLVATLMILSTLVYTRMRIEAVTIMAARINMPRRAVEAQDLHNAVVFIRRSKSHKPCERGMPRHFVFMRDNNLPDLSNDVLWVNSFSNRSNREFMTYFPDRTGHVLQWTENCEIEVKPIAGGRAWKRAADSEGREQ